MTSDLGDDSQINELCEQLLQRADAAGVWPTPVGAIVAAADLTEPSESPFSESALESAPSHLKKAVALIRGRRLRGLLDRRERTVSVDPKIEYASRKRWVRLHEVTHDLLPWQRALGFADDDFQLSHSANQLFERQANHGASRLLFQGERFDRMAGDYAVSFGAVAALANTVGSSLRATLRQFAETHHSPVCGLVLEASPQPGYQLAYRRHEFSVSETWATQFGRTWPRVLGADGFPFLSLIGNEEDEKGTTVTIPDLNCVPTEVRIEIKRTRFCVLLLMWTPRREFLRRKRTLARDS